MDYGRFTHGIQTCPAVNFPNPRVVFSPPQQFLVRLVLSSPQEQSNTLIHVLVRLSS